MKSSASPSFALVLPLARTLYGNGHCSALIARWDWSRDTIEKQCFFFVYPGLVIDEHTVRQWGHVFLSPQDPPLLRMCKMLKLSTCDDLVPLYQCAFSQSLQAAQQHRALGERPRTGTQKFGLNLHSGSGLQDQY